MDYKNNHEFEMQVGSVNYSENLLDICSPDGTVTISGVNPDDIVQMFRNFTCANHNFLNDTKESWTKDMIIEIKNTIEKYLEENKTNMEFIDWWIKQ